MIGRSSEERVQTRRIRRIGKKPSAAISVADAATGCPIGCTVRALVREAETGGIECGRVGRVDDDGAYRSAIGGQARPYTAVPPAGREDDSEAHDRERVTWTHWRPPLSSEHHAVLTGSAAVTGPPRCGMANVRMGSPPRRRSRFNRPSA